MLNKMKSRYVQKTLIVLFLFTSAISAQQFKVTELRGDVKYLSGTSEVWAEINVGEDMQMDGFISTGKNSSVQIKESGNIFNIGELSAVSISSIKKMSTDELLLALAMEDMINAPKTNGKGNSSSTATYGTKEGAGKTSNIIANDFGILRLNGAMQLANNGLMESSVIFAKETYRKYPETINIASYRIFFADVLYEKGLYEEALGDYLEIQTFELNKEQITEVESQIDNINKILLNN